MTEKNYYMNAGMRSRLHILRDILHNSGIQLRTVLDIGAHEGKWAKDFADIFPDTKIFMIEGDNDKANILENTPFSYAIAMLSDKIKSTTFYKTKLDITTGNSLYLENTVFFNNPDSYITETVMTTTLAEIVHRHNLSDIDLIKLDVQGSERDILVGGIDVVKSCKFLILELPIVEYNKGAPSLNDIMIFLDNIGFKMYDIIDLQYLDKTLIQFDAIFIRKDLNYSLELSA